VGKRYEKEGLLSRLSGVIGSISTALPIFDIWPYRYTTVYDLRDGMDPVLSRDPGFYQRYRDVGQFPEVDSIGTDIQTRLFKAFGGWANPLM
jgi:putative cardiolipin synthase